MQVSRFLGLVLVFLLLAAAWAQSASADEAAALYDPSTVAIVDLELTSQAETELEAEPDEYVEGAFSLTKTTDGTPAGEEATPVVDKRPVEVRLKGSVGGSFRDLTKKAAFKLKFKKANAVLGLRKMTLNNMVQDPSMVHETLAYAAFRAAGVPASRTGFAYLRVNDEDFGVYLNLENLDDIALARIFGTFDDEVQHLYEGERGNDVFPGGAAGFEIDEGPDDRGDLEALVGAVNDEGATPFSDRVAPHADLAEMTRMWAVEKYIDHWDGYAGHTDQAQAEAAERPNNYYLYSEPSGRFQMLPWGTDQAWIPTIGVGTPGREVTFDGPGGLLFNKCLDDKECFRSYWTGLNMATHAIPGLDPGALAEGIADLLAPWQQEERDNGNGRAEFDASEVDDGVEETLDFIAVRQAEAGEWLEANPPPAKPTLPALSPPQSSGTLPAPSSGPLLFFVRSKQSTRSLAAHLYLTGPGFVSLKAKMKTPEGERTACADHERVSRSGPVALHCKLSAAALRSRSRRALPLTLRMHLALADGRLETILRQIRLPRG